MTAAAPAHRDPADLLARLLEAAAVPGIVEAGITMGRGRPVGELRGMAAGAAAAAGGREVRRRPSCPGASMQRGWVEGPASPAHGLGGESGGCRRVGEGGGAVARVDLQEPAAD